MPMNGPSTNRVFSSYWKFRQAEVLEDAPPRLQNYFIYALQTVDPQEIDPTKALAMDLHPWRHLVWSMDRNMWSTPALLHAARYVSPLLADGSGAKVGDGLTAQPNATSAGSPESKAPQLFTFIPVRVEVDDSGRTKKRINDPNPNAQIFQITDQPHYSEGLREVLHDLFRHFPLARSASP